MTVGVIGLGYVGLPLAVAFAEAGRDVVAVDVNHLVIDGLRAGRSHIQDVSDESLGRVRNRIEATSVRAPWSAVRPC